MADLNLREKKIMGHRSKHIHTQINNNKIIAEDDPGYDYSYKMKSNERKTPAFSGSPYLRLSPSTTVTVSY